MEFLQKKRNYVPLALAAVIAGYLIVIACINFSVTPAFYDADMYSDVLYAIKAWEEKTIFPQNWVFGNQLNAVSAPVLAALFYGIFGDVFFSMALASTLMGLGVLLAFDWMLRPAVKDGTQRLLCLTVFMTVVLYYGSAVEGNLGWNLFFTMCSYYAGYSITAFLAFGCYLRAGKGFDRALIGMLAVTGLLSFGTGIQSIRQTAIMVVPLAAAEGLRLAAAWIRKEKMEKAPLIAAAAVAVCNLAGLVYAGAVAIHQVEILGSIQLTTPRQWPEAAVGCLLTMMRMLLNSDRISYLVLAAIGLICLLALPGLWRKLRDRTDPQAITLAFLLLMGVLVIAGIDVLTTMHVWGRYYFLLFPLLGCMAAWCYGSCRKAGRAVMLLLLTALVGLTFLEELVPAGRQMARKEEDFAYEIAAYLEENGYDYLFSIWGQGEGVGVVSDCEIMVGFWDMAETPFKPMGYLYDPVIFEAEPERCAYLFDGEWAAELGRQAAREKGVELEQLTYFESMDCYLFAAPINLMNVFS